MEQLIPIAGVIALLVASLFAGFAGGLLAGKGTRSELRRLDADIDDCFDRIESSQKRMAARAKRSANDDDDEQQSLPGVADPKLKARIRAAWLSRKAG